MTKAFNIIVGNHGAGVHVSDQLEYFYNGIKLGGGIARFSHSRWEKEQINILLENFENSQFTESIYQIKQRYPATKLFMIVTELMVAGRMNSAEHQGRENSDLQYENNGYWQSRTANFKKILPHADGIICVSEALFDGYKDICKTVHYIPLAYYKPPVPLPHISNSDKDIDILFSGTPTPYRKTVLDSWAREGFRVEELSVHTPDYVRVDYCARAKIYVGLKLSPETRLLSKCRAQFVLNHEMPHVFEPVSFPTDIDEFLNFVPPGMDIKTYVTQCLRTNKIPQCRHRAYKESKTINIRSVFRDLIHYCNGEAGDIVSSGRKMSEVQ